MIVFSTGCVTENGKKIMPLDNIKGAILYGGKYPSYVGPFLCEAETVSPEIFKVFAVGKSAYFISRRPHVIWKSEYELSKSASRVDLCRVFDGRIIDAVLLEKKIVMFVAGDNSYVTVYDTVTGCFLKYSYGKKYDFSAITRIVGENNKIVFASRKKGDIIFFVLNERMEVDSNFIKELKYVNCVDLDYDGYIIMGTDTLDRPVCVKLDEYYQTVYVRPLEHVEKSDSEVGLKYVRLLKTDLGMLMIPAQAEKLVWINNEFESRIIDYTAEFSERFNNKAIKFSDVEVKNNIVLMYAYRDHIIAEFNLDTCTLEIRLLNIDFNSFNYHDKKLLRDNLKPIVVESEVEGLNAFVEWIM